MGLKYNISYELAAVPYMFIICVFLKCQYGNRSVSELNHRFRVMTYLCFAADVMDVVTAITISYAAVIPVEINMVLNTLYAASCTILGSYFLKYVAYAADEDGHIVYRFFDKLYYLYYVLLAANMFTGVIFSFDAQGNYIHGRLYAMMYIMPMIYMFDALVVLFVRRGRFEGRQVINIFLFSTLSMIGPLVQAFVFPDVLLSVFTVTLAVVIMLFSLETPDYQRLQKTMKELARTKEEAERAKEAAQAANQAKSDFLANMSHELRTPITSVMGMDEMILRESTESQIREYAQNIQSASENLLNLINDTLDFSKIEAGRMEIVESGYQLASFLNNVVMMTRMKAEEKGLDFEIMVDENLPQELYGDEMRLRQITLNILNNAVKYTREGSIYFSVRGRRMDEGRLQLKISVTDTGIGIQEEDLPKVFTDFERFDQRKNRNIEGTGLGLAITKKLAELMGGQIDVNSVYGDGSTFTVTVPQRVVSGERIGSFQEQHGRYPDSPDRYHESFVAPDAHILIVDDDKMNHKVLEGLLKQTKVQIDSAYDGRECLSKIVHRHYDVVLLDHMMPVMDGIETLRQAKSLENNKCRDTPFVALTANAVVGMREMYLKEGFDDYMSKPIEGALLEALLRKYIPKEKLQEPSGVEP